MNNDNDENHIIQNLKDAGCDHDTITAFVEDVRKQNITQGLQLLAIHRRTLLDNLHKEQKQIDCLDYLIYQIEKENKNI
ncbi:MAG: hypothetical protein HFH63_08750 [Lachnospiraceae bacterium]|jgi:hypothetical protein|nr:hypothetical protein [Lachnospiraceae bacterium]MCI8825953.1 hypothetical protein [Lachnospiraceae bacterium]